MMSIGRDKWRGQKGTEDCCERNLGPTWSVALKMYSWIDGISQQGQNIYFK